ncbi:class I SAM-dependent methyltransferase [Lentzea alba]|uniref:class I SAM-dependent methyltransferase n=1 Tax=Lentzea alba TaxID=2714351 RepID=UPI0039BF8EE8
MTALQTLEDTCRQAMGALLPFDGVAPQYAWLLERWQAVAEPGEPFTPPGPEFELAYAELGFPPRMARFHRAALARLPQLLRGEIAVQQLLFDDGDVLAAFSAYQDNVFTARLNAAVAAQVPVGAKVVELGGGTGRLTSVVLRAVGSEDYLFTDISRLFTLEAARRFGVRTALLDIDEPHGTADAVVAGHVLHNARHIGKTLAGIHRMLSPGGRLIFTEAVRDNLVTLTSMQFLLPPPTERDWIFLTAEQWQAELTAAGFTLVATLPDASGQQMFCAEKS